MRWSFYSLLLWETQTPRALTSECVEDAFPHQTRGRLEAHAVVRVEQVTVLIEVIPACHACLHVLSRLQDVGLGQLRFSGGHRARLALLQSIMSYPSTSVQYVYV